MALEPHRYTHQARGRGFLVPNARSRAWLASRESIAFGATQRGTRPVGMPDEGPDQPYRRSLPAGPIPYHLDYGQPKGDVVQLLPPVPVVTVPVVAVRGYSGETFLVQQPFVAPPHPSGLPDDWPLGTGEE